MLGTQEALGGLVGGLTREGNDRQRLDHRRRHVLGPLQRGERDEIRTVCEVRLHRARRLQRQARLAHPSGAREGQQPHAVDEEAVRDRPHVVVTADRQVGRRRQPVGPTGAGRQRGQRRELRRQVADDELEELFGAIEVLEPVLAEVPERDVARQLVGDQLARGARDQHLSAVAGRADPRGAMDVQADVVIVSDLGLAGVDADPHADVDTLGPALGRQRPLRAHRGGDRVARPREGDEERIALGVDLAPVVLGERRPQQALVLGEHLGVAAAQPRQQPRRAFDVAEQERDGAGRKLRDTPATPNHGRLSSLAAPRDHRARVAVECLWRALGPRALLRPRTARRPREVPTRAPALGALLRRSGDRGDRRAHRVVLGRARGASPGPRADQGRRARSGASSPT